MKYYVFFITFLISLYGPVYDGFSLCPSGFLEILTSIKNSGKDASELHRNNTSFLVSSASLLSEIWDYPPPRILLAIPVIVRAAWSVNKSPLLVFSTSSAKVRTDWAVKVPKILRGPLDTSTS